MGFLYIIKLRRGLINLFSCVLCPDNFGIVFSECYKIRFILIGSPIFHKKN